MKKLLAILMLTVLPGILFSQENKTGLEERVRQARLNGDAVTAHELQMELGKENGETAITVQDNCPYDFELNTENLPPFEGDYNVSQIHSLNTWSNAVGTEPPTSPNFGKVWVAATEFRNGGPDTIKFYSSTNHGQSWSYYGKLFININGDYRADELDIEIVYDGTATYIFGVAGYNDFVAGIPKCLCFRLNTANGSSFAFQFKNPNWGNNYKTYNPRITSDNTLYTNTTWLMISYSDRVDCNGTDANYYGEYAYVDNIFTIPTFHYQTIQLGTSGCPLPFAANYYIYNDVGYSNFGGHDRTYVIFHINAGASYNATTVSLYNGYNLFINNTALTNTNENYGQRMATNGGNNVPGGIITYIRKFSATDWDLYCWRTTDGLTWSQQVIDASTRRARWADVIANRVVNNGYKVGYIQDNPASPSGFYTGNTGSNWSDPVGLVISNQQIDTTYTRVRAGYNSGIIDNCLAIYANANTYFAYASRLCTSTTGLENQNQTPNKFSLEQNYPNPFNPSTKIKFFLAQFTKGVKLEVYNVLGNLVKTLVSEDRAAGQHEIRFDGSNLASGVYMYKLTAGNFRETKKMLLVK
jgi:hypothetical protein